MGCVDSRALPTVALDSSVPPLQNARTNAASACARRPGLRDHPSPATRGLAMKRLPPPETQARAPRLRSGEHRIAVGAKQAAARAAAAAQLGAIFGVSPTDEESPIGPHRSHSGDRYINQGRAREGSWARSTRQSTWASAAKWPSRSSIASQPRRRVAVSRFQQEARACRRHRSPNIWRGPTISVSSTTAVPTLVMKLIGTTLADRNLT